MLKLNSKRMFLAVHFLCYSILNHILDTSDKWLLDKLDSLNNEVGFLYYCRLLSSCRQLWGIISIVAPISITGRMKTMTMRKWRIHWTMRVRQTAQSTWYRTASEVTSNRKALSGQRGVIVVWSPTYSPPPTPLLQEYSSHSTHFF